MATNIIYKPGQHLPAPVAANTRAGTAVRIGSLNAITVTDRAKTDVPPLNADGTINTAYNAGGGNANGNASVWFEGVVQVVVTSATAPTFGQPVHLSASGLTTTAGSDPLWGHAVDLAPVAVTTTEATTTTTTTEATTTTTTTAEATTTTTTTEAGTAGTFITLVRISN